MLLRLAYLFDHGFGADSAQHIISNLLWHIAYSRQTYLSVESVAMPRSGLGSSAPFAPFLVSSRAILSVRGPASCLWRVF